MTTVHNLASEEARTYSLPPREAVIAAYAQSRGDWQTTDYVARYGHLVRYGLHSVSCGDFAALREEREED